MQTPYSIRLIVLGLLVAGSLTHLWADPNQVHADVTSKSYETYDEVVAATKKLYDAGVDRTKIAVWLEEVVDKRIVNTNDPVEIIGRSLVLLAPYRTSKVAALRNTRAEAGLDYETYGVIGRMAWDAGVGQCEENANLIYGILKSAGVKENIRLVEVNGDHIFPVWGMADGANPNRPETWGDDALIVDSWYGGVLKPNDVNENWWFRNGDKSKPIQDETRSFDPDAEMWRVDEENTSPDDPVEDCFIATAVYGTEMAPQVKALQYYRDQQLVKTWVGRLFISTYNTFGPILAYWLKDHPSCKAWVRKQIVRPAVTFAERKNQAHENH
jgi:hypothetical protein